MPAAFTRELFNLRAKAAAVWLAVVGVAGFGSNVPGLAAPVAQPTAIAQQTKADVNAALNSGSTALLMASYKGYVDVVRSLTSAKADVNIKTDTGYTALSLATQALNSAKSWSRPVSRVLSRMIIPLGSLSPKTSSGLPGST